MGDNGGALILAIDAGKTGCRATLFDGERRVAMGTGPGVENVAAPGSLPAIVDALAVAVDALPATARQVDAVAAGFTGVWGRSEPARRLADALATEIKAARVVITGDMVATYCGALGLRPGVVIAAGTGAIALGVAADRSHAFVDGWGYLLGDAGSGFLVGRQGLESALRSHDGRGGSGRLRELAEERFGPLAELPSAVYGAENPVSVVAGFAGDVARAATEGDLTALAIWKQAARQLAATVIAAVRRVHGAGQPVDLSWNGGVFGAGALVLDPMLRAVRERVPGVRPVQPAGDAVEGARLLAEAPDDHPLAALVHHQGSA